LVDWIIVIIMAAVWFAIDHVEPYHREFSLTNTDLMYTYSPRDSVPVWLLAVIETWVAFL
jgi:diacylglycerol diphosphate phosphatase/phosphatidate phosphatase